MTHTSLSATSGSASSPLKLSWPTLMFFVAFHGIALLSIFCFSWSALLVMVVLHWLYGSIGICLGYHRLMSHHSLQVPRWLEYVLVTVGAFAFQGGPIFWVGGHRQHHAFTEDPEKDPYSAKRGFWWSHFLWIIYPQKSFFDPDSYYKFAPDMARVPYYRWLDRYFIPLQILQILALYAVGGLSFIVYGFFLRVVLLWHSTWLINSASHMWGYRPHESEDASRNLWWAAIFTYGEGWHNNHHAYPKVAKAGWRWWEVDVTWWAILLLQRLGLAQRVTLPPSGLG